MHYLDQLKNGEIDRVEMIKSLVNSVEFRSKNERIKYDVFETFFDFIQICPNDDFLPYVENPPFEGPELCGLVDPKKWVDEEWRSMLLDLKSIPSSLELMHRKGFEWTQTVYGMKKLGMLNDDVHCLGVGAGHEPLNYWLANNTGKVTATDLYEGDWSTKEGKEGDPEAISNPEKFAPFPYREERLTFLKMDGTNLQFDDNMFDFTFSISSIEHFGGHENSAVAMKEIGRTLKPGGVAAIVTEFVINDTKHPEFFGPRELLEYIVAPSGMKLIQLPTFRLPRIAVENPLLDPSEVAFTPHLVLKVGPVLYTSIILFFRKPK